MKNSALRVTPLVIRHWQLANFYNKIKEIPINQPKTIYISCIYTVNMATELVTFKLESEFLKEVDGISKKSGFSNRTDFIRNALREKVDEIKLKEAMLEIAHLKGAAKKKTSEKQYEEVREKAFQELSKKFK